MSRSNKDVALPSIDRSKGENSSYKIASDCQ